MEGHLLIPICKKRSVYAAIDYHGIQLTTILRKIVEHTIGNLLISHLQSHGFGDQHWSLRKMSSARDLLTASISSGILALCKGCKVGSYLTDITAAFDILAQAVVNQAVPQAELWWHPHTHPTLLLCTIRFLSGQTRLSLAV